jgi:hypothetical protein
VRRSRRLGTVNAIQRQRSQANARGLRHLIFIETLWRRTAHWPVAVKRSRTKKADALGIGCEFTWRSWHVPFGSGATAQQQMPSPTRL